tara:strand:- start:380 stop:631 length:252 start_codon:yes stop_codon:yes gene_type:complete
MTPTEYDIEYFDLIEGSDGIRSHCLILTDNVNGNGYKFSVYVTDEKLSIMVEFMDHLIETDISHERDFHEYLKDWIVSAEKET